MSFKFRLLVLVAGVSVLPVLFTVFVFYLREMNARGTDRLPADRFLQMMKWTEQELPARWREGMPEAALPALPPGEEVIVLDNAGRVVFATLPGFRAGELLGAGRIREALTGGRDSRSVVIPLAVDGNPVGAVVQRIPPRPDTMSRVALRLEGPLVYLGFVVIAATALIVLVTRSLQRGIDRLKWAADRVASGELEFELKPRGKDELTALTRSFESMRRALKEERDRQSRFLMAVSHDLKTPLTVIKGYLEAVEDGMAEDPAALRDHLAIIHEKSGMLEARINELIDYVRLSTGQWQLRHRPIGLEGFFTRLSRVFAADAQVFRRGFESRIELPADLELPGDVGLLTRALDNLFHNALRYTREGDRIRLLARQEAGGEVVILFEDDGPGVASEELERIFEPFYRGTASRREPGSGLGLSTVRSILGAHGWSIEAGQPPGRGLSFTIRAGGPPRG